MDAPMDGHGGGGGGGGGYSDSLSHSWSLDNIKPSVIVIIITLFMTLLISVSICLLLRHLSRRCVQRQRLSSSSTSFSSASDSRHFSVRCVSPEIAAPSLLDSLPLFKFSSVTRRSSSGISGDCAVCLSKFEPHDQLRLLPLCCHAFHADCIDTWLVSNQTCPLCRSPLFASESDLMKALLNSSSSGGGGFGENSFRLEIGSISRRQTVPEFDDQQRSYSIGSFDYIIDEESEVSATNAHRRSTSRKEEDAAGMALPPFESSLAAEVGSGSRNWLKDYMDRLSQSISSRAMSFRSSGRFFTGSSRRSEELAAAVIADIEANRAGEEIGELFRWISGV